jgi:hypothetical protein
MALGRDQLRPDLGRSEEIGALLPRVLEFCGHEPGPSNELAVCDHCANKVIVLAGLIEEPEEQMH